MDITRIFSDYRHEWAAGDFNDRFVKPPYYEQFVGHEPVFLVGGRGTGKTVTLRSLHFRNSTANEVRSGIYIKAFKNRVEAFSAANIDPDTQIRTFEHYINLLCCFELADFCAHLSNRASARRLVARATSLAATHFAIPRPMEDPQDLRTELRLKIAQLSAFINDPAAQTCPTLSHGELPVVDLATDLHALLTNDAPLYVCIDEWENLSTDQQQTLNRWIKNCERPITYKIGVREGGMKTTDTGGGADPLHPPADYIETRIAGPSMKFFCRRVVEQRLAHLRAEGQRAPSTLAGLLESLDRQAEAVRLGADDVVKNAIAKSGTGLDDNSRRWLRASAPGDAYLALFQAERTGKAINEIISGAVAEPHHWKNVKNNYGHLSLFSITRGLKGSDRQKFYAGANTYIELSGGNVRYLLELLDEALRELSPGVELPSESELLYRISADIQTDAAVTVARRRLRQIEVLSDRGLEVLRLVMGLGTAFAALVREPGRYAPERTSFTLRGDRDSIDYLMELLNEGSAILAFIRETANKRTTAIEPKDHEYRIHPILAPHFCIPYRRKRRSELDAKALREALHDKDAPSLVREVVGLLKLDATQEALF